MNWLGKVLRGDPSAALTLRTSRSSTAFRPPASDARAWPRGDADLLPHRHSARSVSPASSRRPHRPLPSDSSPSVLNAVPHWWLGLIIIILIANFKVATRLSVPAHRRIKTLGRDGFDPVDYLSHLILPGVDAWDRRLGDFCRYMRSETLEVLGQDFVRTAYAKGLADRVVTFRHILRNALIPVVTISGGLFVSLSAARCSSSQCLHGRDGPPAF